MYPDYVNKPLNDGRQWGDEVHYGRDHEVNGLRALYLSGNIEVAELDRLLYWALRRDC